MKIEVTIKTVAESQSWFESHPGTAAWVQAFVAALTLIPVGYGAWEIFKRQRTERAHRKTFLARMKRAVAEVQESYSRYISEPAGKVDLLIFRSAVTDIVRVAADRPDWVGHDVATKSQICHQGLQTLSDLAGEFRSLTTVRPVAQENFERLVLIKKRFKEMVPTVAQDFDELSRELEKLRA